MTTFRDPVQDSAHSKFNSRQPEKKEMHLITSLSEMANQFQVRTSRERRLKTKIFAAVGAQLDFFQHESSRSKRSRLGCKRGHTLRNEIGVNENPAICVVWQELPGEGGLACSIWPSDNVNVRAHYSAMLATSYIPGIFMPAMRRAKLGLPMPLNILRI